MDVFDLQAKLSIDTSEFERSIASALENMQKLSKAFSSASSGQAGYSQSIDNATKSNEKSAESLSTLSDRLRGLSKIGTPLDGLFSAAAKVADSFNNMRDKIEKVRHPIETMRSAVSSVADKFKYAGTTMWDWQAKLDSAKKKVDALTQSYNESAKETGENSEETKRLAESLAETMRELKKAQNDLDGYKEQVEETGEEEEEAEEKTHKFADALKNVGSKAVSAVAGLAKMSAAALAAAGAAVGKLAKDALDAYGSYEQLKGGVETLFGADAQKVLNNSERAFKTAGMSMNEYMETSIQSAAALINSLDGDTAKAADLMDISITDMADNVNKMGTTMEAVQNAYRGFSRGNFTMLDNLALGFSGTKEGMQQLLDKAEEISGVKFDISSYSDIVKAIHVVQEEMGISGTTMEEAAGTIQGSVFSMQAAWKNLVTNLARDDADISELIDTLVSSIETAASNILPRFETILGGIADLITKVAPMIAEKLPAFISSVVPSLLDSATKILDSLTSALPMMVEALLPPLVDGTVRVFTALVGQLPAILQIITDSMPMIIDAVMTVLPMLMQATLDILFAIADGLIQNIPVLVPAIVDLMIKLADMLVDNLDEIIDAAIAIVEALADALTNQDTLTKLIQAVPRIVTKIVDVLVEKAPELMLAAVEIIAQLADAILSNLDMIFQAGADIISALWNGMKSVVGSLLELLAGIGEELGFLIYDWIDETVNWIKGKWNGFVSWWNGVFEAFGQFIFDVVQGIKDNIQQRIDAIKAFFVLGWQVIKDTTESVWLAIRNAIWSAMDWIKQKVDGIKEIKDTFVEAFKAAIDYIKDLPGKALQWGKDLIENFIGGIKEKTGALVDGIKGVAQSVKDFLGFSEPEKGPLSNFHTFAPDMMQLYADGIRQNSGLVTDQVGELAGNVAAIVDGMGDTDAFGKIAESADALNALEDTVVMFIQPAIDALNAIAYESGKDFVQRFVDGIKDSASVFSGVFDSIEIPLAEIPMAGMDVTSVPAVAENAAMASAPSYSTYNVNISIDGYNKDPRELAEELAGYLEDIETRKDLIAGVVAL